MLYRIVWLIRYSIWSGSLTQLDGAKGGFSGATGRCIAAKVNALREFGGNFGNGGHLLGSRSEILDACADEGISPKIAAYSSQADFIVELVAAGFGIGFLPRMIAESRPPRSVRHVLLDNAKCRWRVALAWRRSGFLSHAAHAWLAHARGEQVKNG